MIARVPVLGILAYLLFGEVRVGQRRVARLRSVLENMPPASGAAPGSAALARDR